MCVTESVRVCECADEVRRVEWSGASELYVDEVAAGRSSGRGGGAPEMRPQEAQCQFA